MQRRVSRCDMTGPKLKQLAKPLPRHPSQSSSRQCRPSPAVSAVSAKSRRVTAAAESLPSPVSPLRLTATTRVRLAAPVCPELSRELRPSSAVSSTRARP